MRHMVSFRHFHFNPRLQEGDDVFSLMFSDSKRISIHASEKEATPQPGEGFEAQFISIHASEKEATDFSNNVWRVYFISIHASEKEATQDAFAERIGMKDFNPRLREGGDNDCEHSRHCIFSISIHASEKEATFRYSLLCIPGAFQSTPPRRRRQFQCGHDKIYIPYFNPRLREGGDVFLMQ